MSGRGHVSVGPPRGKWVGCQRIRRAWPALPYRPVARGGRRCRTSAFPRGGRSPLCDCVTKFTITLGLGRHCRHGVLNAVMPAPDITHVMVWAEFGDSANVRIADFAFLPGAAWGGPARSRWPRPSRLV